MLVRSSDKLGVRIGELLSNLRAQRVAWFGCIDYINESSKNVCDFCSWFPFFLVDDVEANT